jgi:AraC-like DNA-binding protein
MGYGEFRELMDLGDIRRAVCEAEVSSLHCMARLGHGSEGVFKEIRFDYPRPPYAEKYTELFQCNVVFDAPCHTLVFDADNLEKPLKLANPLVRHAMEQECRRLLPLLKQHESMTHRIHQELSSQKEGFSTLDQLARRFSLSPRTLRRRLVDEGTSYNAILAEIRQGRAIELLTTTRLSMENVASHLGFSEVSSFYRAFKSWTGSTPIRFRESHVL